jgi:HsdM N-terminal domain/Type III restriction enzyme, res subunit
VIATIQRVYSMLRGEELDESAEETSGFETWTTEEGEIKPVEYNPSIPIETFDIIVTDECHRSIYGLWRQVLDYFDAFVIGLTATPSKHTLGYFNQNLVSEYPYERSVADGVNVGYEEVYRITTHVTSKGGRVDAGYQVPVRDKRTRAVRYRELDADIDYLKTDLDRSVTVPNQIRTVIQTFKDRLFTDLFPDRSGEWVSEQHQNLVAKVWNYAHVLRDQGVSYGDYVEQITYLLFLKMDQERDEYVNEPSAVPDKYRWSKLARSDGEALDSQYRKTLEALAKQPGLIGTLFRGAQNKLSDPAKLKRVVSLIDKETWIGLSVDTKGEIYEGLLERNAAEVKSGAGTILHASASHSGLRRCHPTQNNGDGSRSGVWNRWLSSLRL